MQKPAFPESLFVIPRSMGLRGLMAALLAGLLWIAAPVQAQDMTADEVAAELAAAAKEGRQPDFSGRDLTGLKLSGLDFAAANLRGAILRNADLSDANLRGIKAQKADLAGASLRRANLDLAIFRGASLAGADLSESSAFSTVFAEADMSKARLRAARLVSNFERTNLRGADLAWAVLAADMKNQPMGLMRVSMIKADLTGANLEFANLAMGMLEFADFTDALMKGTNLRQAQAAGARFTGANLTGANFTKTDIESARFRGVANLDKITSLDDALNADKAFFD